MTNKDMRSIPELICCYNCGRWFMLFSYLDDELIRICPYCNIKPNQFLLDVQNPPAIIKEKLKKFLEPRTAHFRSPKIRRKESDE